VSAFETLGVDPLFLPGLKRRGIVEPTPVQAGTLAAAHEGRDVIAVAPTGGGKTLAFLMPIAKRLRAEPPPMSRTGRVDPAQRLRAVVLAPTRELAKQIAEEAQILFAGSVLRTAVAYGKSAISVQVAALKSGVDLLVATPGRLRELLEADACSLAWLRHLVVDEADRMLDMGFLPQVKAISDRCPTERQTMLYTATMPKAVEELARTLVKDPVRYGERLTAARAEPTAFDVGDKAKTHLLLHLLKEPTRTGVLVFVRTRRRAGWVAEALRRNKVLVGSLHGDRSQKQREAALDGVTQGRLSVLVATDVAARGLHVPSLRCVVTTTCRWWIRTWCIDLAAQATATPASPRRSPSWTPMKPTDGSAWRDCVNWIRACRRCPPRRCRANFARSASNPPSARSWTPARRHAPTSARDASAPRSCAPRTTCRPPRAVACVASRRASRFHAPSDRVEARDAHESCWRVAAAAARQRLPGCWHVGAACSGVPAGQPRPPLPGRRVLVRQRTHSMAGCASRRLRHLVGECHASVRTAAW
jgi:ATP-dependent RNA helicase RhlE